MAKLIGYDYEITYKHGKENLATEALFRREYVNVKNATINPLISVDSTWLPKVQLSWQTDVDLQQLIAKLAQDNNAIPEFHGDKES